MSLLAIALGLGFVSGCTHKQAVYSSMPGTSTSTVASSPTPVSRPPAPTPAPTPTPKAILTPESTLHGTVARVNQESRFVVLNFPIGHMPSVGQRMDLYRRGLHVAEVKVTGPQLDDDIDADVVTGDAQAGDEARDK
jgi:hypothetical protein